MHNALRYADRNFDAFVRQLSGLVAIPSCSFPGFPAAEVARSAQAVAALLKSAGLEHVQVLKLAGTHPYVYGDWLHAPGRPTVLLYAHHDVQPPGRRELWKSDPYKATPRNGRLYGRGAADDKAGIIVHTSAIAAYLKTLGKLPLNVKVIIEGEEEIGSEHLEAFLKKYAKRMQADVMVLTDTANFDVGVPSVTTTLRGIVSTDVTVRTADHPLHSGMWGGPLPDPVQALAKMLASLSGPDGRISIPGIYDEVKGLGALEKRSLATLEYSDREFRRQAQVLSGVDLVGGSASPLEKLWRIPSVSVNAIQASSRRDCANIICESAWSHVGIRTVPDMDPHRTARLLMAHLKKHAPWNVKVEFTGISKAPWWQTDPAGPAFQAAHRALTRGYGREAVFIGSGGTIPFVGPFARVLGGAPALLVGVEDPYTNPHSENESLHLGDFRKSIKSSVLLYQELAGLK